MTRPVNTNGDFANIPQDICRLLPESYEKLNDFYQVQDTLAYTPEQLGGYFHKYFPRSYTETFETITRLFNSSDNYRNIFSGKRHLTILDIGSGIGGNITGMLKYISAAFPQIESVWINSVDGNEKALNYQEFILKNIEFDFTVRFNPIHYVFSPHTVIEELGTLICAYDYYDIVISSKFINEFYRKKPDLKGLYSRFIEFGGSVLNQDGILIITELTDKLPGYGYFNMLFNRETISYYNACSHPLKQVFPIQCHMWRDCCEDGNNCFIQQRFLSGKAKVFTQVFCQASLGSRFYSEQWLDKHKNLPIQIKDTGCYGGHFCYQGKLRDDIKQL